MEVEKKGGNMAHGIAKKKVGRGGGVPCDRYLGLTPSSPQGQENVTKDGG